MTSRSDAGLHSCLPRGGGGFALLEHDEATADDANRGNQDNHSGIVQDEFSDDGDTDKCAAKDGNKANWHVFSRCCMTMWIGAAGDAAGIE
jgi:hypothetical protein